MKALNLPTRDDELEPLQPNPEDEPEQQDGVPSPPQPDEDDD